MRWEFLLRHEERRNEMKKKLALFVAAILLIPAFSFSNIFTFRAGLFIPKAKGNIWQYEFDNLDLTRLKYQNSNFGISYEYFFSREISFVLGLDGYSKKKLGIYENYVERPGILDNTLYPIAVEPGEGDPLVHVFNVSITPIQLSVKLTPMGRGRKLIPYVGGGVGVYIWSLTRQGDFVDFSMEDEYIDYETGDPVMGFAVFTGQSRETSKLSIGYHAFGGFMYAFANRITLEAEFKYNFAEGKLEAGNFRGIAPFDLSGFQISLGINYWY
jgi:opacity protein-like surface antigen